MLSGLVEAGKLIYKVYDKYTEIKKESQKRKEDIEDIKVIGKANNELKKAKNEKEIQEKEREIKSMKLKGELKIQKMKEEGIIEIEKDFIKASKNTYKKKEKIEEIAQKIEKNLIFLGVTAIEDELQDDVNETLKDFSEAGIKLWVLTGDKKDTAKSIAYSCGLFDDEEFNIFEIKEGLSKIQLEARLNELVELFNNIVDKMNKGNKTKIKDKKIKIISKNSNKELSSQNNINNNNNSIHEEEKLKEEISKITWENYGDKILSEDNKFTLSFKERQFIKILLSRYPISIESRRKVRKKNSKYKKIT